MAHGMAFGNGLKCYGEIAERFDIVELAGFDQRRDAGPGMSTFIMTGEQVIFSSKCQRTDPVLDRVRPAPRTNGGAGLTIHLDMTIVEEHLQPAPTVGDIGEMLPQPGLGRDARPFLL